MTPLHGIACFCDVGFGARAVSRKTPIYFILIYDYFVQDYLLTTLDWNGLVTLDQSGSTASQTCILILYRVKILDKRQENTE